MQKIIHPYAFVIFIIAILVTSGCEQSESVTMHEPGVYQGATDNLVTDEAQLSERMKNQMDR